MLMYKYTYFSFHRQNSLLQKLTASILRDIIRVVFAKCRVEIIIRCLVYLKY